MGVWQEILWDTFFRFDETPEGKNNIVGLFQSATYVKKLMTK